MQNDSILYLREYEKTARRGVKNIKIKNNNTKNV